MTCFLTGAIKKSGFLNLILPRCLQHAGRKAAKTLEWLKQAVRQVRQQDFTENCQGNLESLNLSELCVSVLIGLCSLSPLRSVKESHIRSFSLKVSVWAAAEREPTFAKSKCHKFLSYFDHGQTAHILIEKNPGQKFGQNFNHEVQQVRSDHHKPSY